MNEAVKIKIAVVKEDDFKPVTLEVFNDESGIEGISDLVSKSGEISYLDLSNIGLENILLVIDGRPINSKGGYNFSIQIYPIFGPAVFMQFGIDADGNAIVVDMDEETLQSIIDELPTAYDVENVIGKIKEVPHYYLYSHQDLISESDVKKMVREGIN